MNLTLDINVIAAGIIIAVITFLGGLLYRSVRNIERLLYIVGSFSPPTGALGELMKLQGRFQNLRDWAISQGYNEREKV